jgi:malate synthase
MSVDLAARPVQIKGPVEGRAAEVLTPEALDFLAQLHRRFNDRRL